MDKKHIILLCALAALLALFFQFSRMDGFLHLYSVHKNAALEGGSPEEASPVQDSERDRYLIIYDPHDVASVFMRHRLAWLLGQKKKAYDQAAIWEMKDLPSAYKGVLIATGHVGKVASWDNVVRYVENGGTAAVLSKLESLNEEGVSEQGRLYPLGVRALGGDLNTTGLDLQTNFLVGGKGFRIPGGEAYQTSSTKVELADGAVLHISSAEGEPLLWENRAGQGRFFVYNGALRDDKTNVGVMTSLLAHCGDEGIYPVLNAKIFYIDDFPAPVPEGNFDKIFDELGVSTVAFFRDIWWPYMRECAEEYGLKFTGLIIESYGDQVKGPFTPTQGRAARDNLIVYGRELLDMGGELGLHGYNHQSLAVEGYNQDKLGYEVWENQADMEEALRELRRYIHEVYPDYEFTTYVPPSDILSPEGHAAVKAVYPELLTYSSLFDGLYEERAYYQDFERNPDGTHEIPRVSSGYSPSRPELWDEISVINYIGVFSHFVHPDELFYEESKDLTWGEMAVGFKAFMAEVSSRFDWLRPVTAFEATASMDDCLDMDYYVEREAGQMKLVCWNHREPLYFIMRSDKEVDKTEGGECRQIDAGAYLVRVDGSEAVIYWKEQP